MLNHVYATGILKLKRRETEELRFTNRPNCRHCLVEVTHEFSLNDKEATCRHMKFFSSAKLCEREDMIRNADIKTELQTFSLLYKKQETEIVGWIVNGMDQTRISVQVWNAVVKKSW